MASNLLNLAFLIIVITAAVEAGNIKSSAPINNNGRLRVGVGMADVTGPSAELGMVSCTLHIQRESLIEKPGSPQGAN